jgi:hypothetical protein
MIERVKRRDIFGWTRSKWDETIVIKPNKIWCSCVCGLGSPGLRQINELVIGDLEHISLAWSRLKRWRHEIFHFSKTSRLPLWPTQPPFHWMPGIKRPRNKVDNFLLVPSLTMIGATLPLVNRHSRHTNRQLYLTLFYFTLLLCELNHQYWL